MTIISWNVNGIRAVDRKGDLRQFLNTYDPDILFIQEIKSQEDQLDAIKQTYAEYTQYYHSALKKGYAGTSVWIKSSIKHDGVHIGMPGYDDTEGRVIRIDIGTMSYLGIYFPNGGKSPEAWEDKLVFYDVFLSYVNELRRKGKQVVWCGDVNTAHEEIDLARPKDNEGEIGFHPRERAWITKCIEDKWIDMFRYRFPTTAVYSWWHVITRARLRNVGWRIDYFFVDASLVPKVQSISYATEQMGSDHCPVVLHMNM